MAGLIQQEMEDENEPKLPGDPSTPDDTAQHEDAESADLEQREGVAEGGEDEEEGGDEYTAERARSEMQLPDELKDAYERVVQAGLKVMFDPTTRDRTLEFMQGEGDPAQKLGEGVAAVMALLFKESNQTMPPQVIVPAGVELLFHAADVAKAGGMEIDQNTIAEAMAVMVEAIFRQFGVDPQQMQMMNQGGMQ